MAHPHHGAAGLDSGGAVLHIACHYRESFSVVLDSESSTAILLNGHRRIFQGYNSSTCS
jgi:hypothetical protein